MKYFWILFLLSIWQKAKLIYYFYALINQSKKFKTVFDVVSPFKTSNISKIRLGDLIKVFFYFPKFYKFFTKRVTGGLFYNYDITPKEEKQKKLVRRKF